LKARAGWDLDLRHGEAREDALVYVLLRAKVEVKSDAVCKTTGNVFVEFRCNGNPSGISTTTADWWAIECDEDVWLFMPTKRLKTVAARAYRAGMLARGGDGDVAEGVLIPVEWMLKGEKQ
jgi:hypothetical protein